MAASLRDAPSATRPHGQPPLSRDDAVGHVSGLTSVVVRADRLEARLTTWERIAEARREGGVVEGGGLLPGPTSVWVVAVEGDVHPARGRMAGRWSWAIFTIDQRSGSPLTMAAGDGALPGYLATIPDAAP